MCSPTISGGPHGTKNCCDPTAYIRTIWSRWTLTLLAVANLANYINKWVWLWCVWTEYLWKMINLYVHCVSKNLPLLNNCVRRQPIWVRFDILRKPAANVCNVVQLTLKLCRCSTLWNVELLFQQFKTHPCFEIFTVWMAERHFHDHVTGIYVFFLWNME